MQLVWKSHKINNPSVNLIQDIRNTIRNYYIKGHENQYVIKMGSELYKVLHDEIYSSTHINDFMGIDYVFDNNIEDGVYCIYKKDKINYEKLHDLKMVVLSIKCDIDDRLREIEKLTQYLDHVWISIVEIAEDIKVGDKNG